MAPSSTSLPDWLADRLAQPLPGRAAQALLQPELSYHRYFAPPPSHARPAAVLLLLYRQRGHWHLPFTLRPQDLALHAGQISLPGGLVEPGESSQQAALRELHEELGVPAPQVRLLGPLSPIYLFRSNFHITPWLASADQLPSWSPNPREVDQLLHPPLDHLADPGHLERIPRTSSGLSFTAPAYRWQTHAIWGATSLILAELLALYAEFCGRQPTAAPTGNSPSLRLR
jgi:8-oxo-dGTP pyrophosphatase MutT (NUDIX family)